MIKRILRVRARTLTAVAATGLGTAALAAVAAAPAAAALPGWASCPAVATSQPFSQWGDANQYMLVPGGGFSGSAPGWTLTGGARVVSTRVPWDLADNGAAGALYLPAGATAQSPVVCVDASDPTFRLLTQTGGGPASLSIQADYTTALGLQLPLSVSGLAPGASWSTTPPLLTGSFPASLLGGGTAQMSLRFTAGGTGAYIDDVFVDPRMH